jgi:para-aminobenzoate synthetase component 1
LTRAAHDAAVAVIHELLGAGECYQVPLTRRIEFDAAPSPYALFDAIVRAGDAPHAALLTFGDALPDVAVVSASPELFLRVDGRGVETRPIKGTAPDAETLRASEKDHAENVMIVDLARNDLGRVCDFGSVHVPSLCAIEAHPGLHHLVSTIRGRLRDDVTLGALVRATFPPASVTGAPKPRVLQAIEDLEPVRRGAYCGALGWIDADRDRAELAVAIRTFTVAGDRTFFGVGGGIVADSSAAAEWRETDLKAARLLAAAGARAAEVVPAT